MQFGEVKRIPTGPCKKSKQRKEVATGPLLIPCPPCLSWRMVNAHVSIPVSAAAEDTSVTSGHRQLSMAQMCTHSYCRGLCFLMVLPPPVKVLAWHWYQVEKTLSPARGGRGNGILQRRGGGSYTHAYCNVFTGRQSSILICLALLIYLILMLSHQGGRFSSPS